MNKQDLEQEMMEMISGEVVYDRLDGFVAMLLDKFNVENSVTLSIVLYSGLISFAFKEADEAMPFIKELMNNFSSFELYNKSTTLLGADIVEYYKEILLTDYAIKQQPLMRSLDQLTSEYDKTIGEFMESYDDLKGLLPEEQ